jgi:nicotinate-nucleotide pyrophosphorylase (carboxylating)
VQVDPSVRAVIESAGLEPWLVDDVVSRALIEDVGAEGDLTTTATVPGALVGSADLVARQPGTVAGLPVAAWVFDSVGQGRLRVEFGAIDGTPVTRGEVLATIRGPVRDLLTAERTARNVLGHLSGIATLTRAWVHAVAGTGAQIRDTRQTLPGLRALQKYAVRCGGGVNRRASLSDAAVVKAPHAAGAGGLVEAFERARAEYPDVPLEVEVHTVAQARAVIDAGARLVLLVDMSLDDMREIIERRSGSSVRFEACGVPLDQARAVAEAGVQFLAVGTLTHSAPAFEVGFALQAGGRG